MKELHIYSEGASSSGSFSQSLREILSPALKIESVTLCDARINLLTYYKFSISRKKVNEKLILKSEILKNGYK